MATLIEPLAGMNFVGSTEVVEGGKELIMTAYPGGWDEGTHGERVYEGVVELLVFEELSSGNLSFGADGERRLCLAYAGIRGQSVLDWIDAELVVDSIFDDGLGVDRARQMHVEIGAFRHLLQECVQRQRPGMASGLKGGGCVEFRLRLGARQRWQGGDETE